MKKPANVSDHAIEIATLFIARHGLTNEVDSILAKYAMDLRTILGRRQFTEIVDARHEIYRLFADAGVTKTTIARAFNTPPDNVYYLVGPESRRGARFQAVGK